jgi:hypothetical protein
MMSDQISVRSIVAAAALAAMAVTAPTAEADQQTPAPTPYQIAGTFPGVQVYPPWCARNMMACGFRYHADTGTWQPVGDQ